ncbi:hypothetical protein MCOR02_006872 [Pyricularia oryzae]|uniref:FAD/NAD(P)-binding domain-containing protein n=2 Tax=Pyricularia oryzae TaxID=318829 RepID=A0AA97PAU5_PYRO3|nr:hypothetical protein OOU_Y34scaffold00003g2 [Pyricularia oryzae Y34]KAH9432167.1 hypothetical protein MCOR02_006872 [Pyricularia oryzae]KAI6474367.1 hypothetical protein MCOR17_002173 [Pyricularia oryzae]KAI6579222.1 hypothetical protein MCOR04_006133 [Pyricularia oryzae]KAI7910733.1 hypothetical protein M0657_011272 [Pyricularia oryzae]
MSVETAAPEAMADVIVIGAGPSGLCAAKTFLQLQPDASVVILEAFPSLGGVWATERLFPTLRTNNLTGNFEFTDFPLTPERFGASPGQHIPGESMNAYYKAYAEHHQLTGRIRYNAKASEVRRPAEGEGWLVEVEDTSKPHDDEERQPPQTETLRCRKLIVATGVHPKPRIAELQGAADFKGPIIHSSEMGPKFDTVFNSGANKEGDDNSAQRKKTICVIGGSKSSYDAAYLACVTGHEVDWVIRETGRGPSWIMPSWARMGPFKLVRERLARVRFISFMSPWAFDDFSGVGWLREAVHGTAAGRFVKGKFWKLMHFTTAVQTGFKGKSPHRVLEPEHSPFWYGTATGIDNYDKSLHDFVNSGQIRVHRDDISHLSEHKVHLCRGQELQVDAIVAATGYWAKPAINFVPESTHSGLGVPSISLSQSQQLHWRRLEAASDAKIGARFPELIKGPPQSRKSKSPAGRWSKSSTATGKGAGGRPALYKFGSADHEMPYSPWRLYRGIAPPGLAATGDRSLAFVGIHSNLSNMLRLEVQSLWAASYLLGHALDDPNLDGSPRSAKAIFEEAALLQRWSQRRAPLGHGRSFPDMVFDQIPYWDLLLHDLGLPTARKGSLWRELFEPYTQQDFGGLVDEYLAKGGARRRASEESASRHRVVCESREQPSSLAYGLRVVQWAGLASMTLWFFYWVLVVRQF